MHGGHKTPWDMKKYHMIELRKVCIRSGRFCSGMGDYIGILFDTFYLSAALENVGMRNTSFGIGAKKKSEEKYDFFK